MPELGSPDAEKGGTTYGALSDFPRTLRVVGPDSNGSFRPYLLDNNMISLAQRHPDEFDFYPGTAEAWAVDRENKTVYVKLDPDARWSDGEPLTTDDFMFMFYFYQSEYIVAPWYNNWFGTQYTNITKYDDHTFSVSVPQAKPDMDNRVLQLSGAPEHFYQELGDDYVERYQWRFVPTTGAYAIKDENIRKGRSIALTRVEDWWAKDDRFFKNRFNVDRIQLNVIRETPKRFESFKRGDLDQFGLNLAEYWYDKLPNDDPDVQAGYIHKSVFYNQRPRPTYGLWINTSKPLLANRDIRVGINHASNWQLVIERFFRGDFKRMKTSSDGYDESSHPTLEAREFDIEKALESFAKAGFTERGPNGILVNDEGQRLSFTLSTGYESMKDVLTILKQEAAKAGLELRLEVLDGTAGWKKVQEKKHDIHFAAFGVSLEMYPRFWETYHSDNAYDDAFLEDGSINPDRSIKTQTNNLEVLAIPEMDQMIDQYRTSSSKEEMIELAHEMTELHHEHASFVPGFVNPFYRVGYWRWVRYPDFFNHKYSSGPTQLHVHWIDTEMKAETKEAMDEGQTFEPQINVYDRFK
ncbi:MAG: extracellular solute-binding protein [Gammaproteobacteria bacterium]|nr:extracellular solute-binding protein [Gammaproteobacteria bacterium]